MAFKGLSERFTEQVSNLYNRESARGPDGVGQPFLEYRPNSPDRRDTLNDSRIGAAFSASYRRDLRRMTRFLQSPDGVVFLARQAELQSGNTFEETRIINPLFVIGNVPGTLRMRRSLGSASGTELIDQTGSRSAGATDNVGAAGRLQLTTKNKSISMMMGRRGPTNLLSLFPPNRVTRAISFIGNIFGIRNSGILAVNDRPEIDFDGQFFSTRVWLGFKRQDFAGNVIDRASNMLRTGNIRGAIRTINTGIGDIRRTFDNIRRSPANFAQTLTTGDRGTPTDSTLNGWRYFVANRDNADTGVDRYIRGVVTFTPINSGVSGQLISVPTVQPRGLKKIARPLTGDRVFTYSPKDLKGVPSVVDEDSSPIQLSPLSTERAAPPTFPRIGNTAPQDTVRRNSSKLRTLRRVGSATLRFGVQTLNTAVRRQSFLPNIIQSLRDASPIADNSTAEALMTYPELSLQSRYNAMLESMGGDSAVDTQRSSWNDSITKLKQERTFVGGRVLGIAGGFVPGANVPDNIAELRVKFQGADDPDLRGRYFHDTANDIAVYSGSGYRQPSVADVEKIRSAMGDTTDFMFYDFVNNNILPFRAFIADVNESITTNVSDQQYIGRIERNVVYLGVTRELSITFRIQAFNPNEMESVWTKINYLTGLTYPSKYVNGFLVPPLIKLTIGNVYVDQPGYIKSLNYKMDDDGWEIDTDYQAPMGITVSMTYSVIEKGQANTFTRFYPYGSPRVDAPRPVVQSKSSAAGVVTPPSVPKPGKITPKLNLPKSTIDGKKLPTIQPINPRSLPPILPDNTRVTPRVPPLDPRISDFLNSTGGGLPPGLP